MTTRRADAAPGLLDRVRWGNVGRLVALLAGVALLLTGPKGCGESTAHRAQRTGPGPGPPVLPQALKPAVPKPSLPVVRKKRQRHPGEKKRARQHHHRAQKPAPVLAQSVPPAPVSPAPSVPQAPSPQ